MDALREIFENKPQEIICMTLYYELGECDFKKLVEMARKNPNLELMVKKSYKVHTRTSDLYLVPADLIPERA